MVSEPWQPSPHDLATEPTMHLLHTSLRCLWSFQSLVCGKPGKLSNASGGSLRGGIPALCMEPRPWATAGHRQGCVWMPQCLSKKPRTQRLRNHLTCAGSGGC
jgi:hypothetical protein